MFYKFCILTTTFPTNVYWNFLFMGKHYMNYTTSLSKNFHIHNHKTNWILFSLTLSLFFCVQSALHINWKLIFKYWLTLCSQFSYVKIMEFVLQMFLTHFTQGSPQYLSIHKIKKKTDKEKTREYLMQFILPSICWWSPLL